MYRKLISIHKLINGRGAFPERDLIFVPKYRQQTADSNFVTGASPFNLEDEMKCEGDPRVLNKHAGGMRTARNNIYISFAN